MLACVPGQERGRVSLKIEVKKKDTKTHEIYNQPGFNHVSGISVLQTRHGVLRKMVEV